MDSKTIRRYRFSKDSPLTFALQNVVKKTIMVSNSDAANQQPLPLIRLQRRPNSSLGKSSDRGNEKLQTGRTDGIEQVSAVPSVKARNGSSLHGQRDKPSLSRLLW
jgi:hypothetical protein